MNRVFVPWPGVACLSGCFASARGFAPVLALACVLALPARPAAAGGMAEVAAWAPDDIDLLVAVDDAAALRAGPFGPTLTVVARDWLAAGDLGAAWQRFAAVMGMEERQAFDALVGRRVVFCSRGAEAHSAWAVVSMVDASTERLLRERLQPAPRKIEGGLPVLSLEEGRLWLAVSAAAPAGAEDGPRALLLGPAEAPQVFDQIAASLGRPAARSLAKNPIFHELQTIAPESSALMMIRLRERAADGPSGWLALSARAQGRTLVFGIVARTAALSDAAARVTPWPRDQFAELAEGAFAAVMEWIGPGAEPEPAWTLRSLLELTRIPFGFGFDQAALLGPRRAFVVRPAENGLAGFAVAFETEDTAGLAPSGDRFLGSMVSLMNPARPPPGQQAAPAEQAAADFGGQFPEAMREVDLSRSIGTQFPRVFDRGPSLAWVYAPTEPEWMRARAPDQKPRGWWVLGLERSAVSATAAALADARVHRDKAVPWLSLGVLRPSALADGMSNRGVAPPPRAEAWLRALRAVALIDWEVHRAATGSVVGRARVSLSD